MSYAVLAWMVGEDVLVQQPSNTNKLENSSKVTQWLWHSWDTLFRRLWGIRPLRSDQPHLLCVAQHRYYGPPFTVDGVQVHRFDRVIELHMDNRFLVQALNEHESLVGLAARLRKEANRSLGAIAECISSPKYYRIKVLCSLTCIHRVMDRFGFTVFPVQNRFSRITLTWYLRKIFSLTNPRGQSLVQIRPEVFVPKLVAISRERLLSKYGGASEHST